VVLNIYDSENNLVYKNTIYSQYNINTEVQINKTGEYILKILAVDMNGADD